MMEIAKNSSQFIGLSGGNKIYDDIMVQKLSKDKRISKNESNFTPILSMFLVMTRCFQLKDISLKVEI